MTFLSSRYQDILKTYTEGEIQVAQRQIEEGLRKLKVTPTGILTYETRHENSDELLTEESIAQFLLCQKWLAEVETVKTVNNSSPSSYRLKHLVEKWAGIYISNGIFILAAISEEVPMKLPSDPQSPNPCFGISKKYTNSRAV